MNDLVWSEFIIKKIGATFAPILLVKNHKIGYHIV